MAVGVGHEIQAIDEFHHEVGPALLGASRVVDAGDRRVVHHGQRLTLGLEAGEDGRRVQAGLEHLQSDAPTHRFALPGAVDDGEATLADLFDDPVRTDRLGVLERLLVHHGRLDHLVGSGVLDQQCFQLGA